MSDLYHRIEELCKKHNETVTTLCKECGASRASLSDLKVGRKQSLSTATLSKIALHFNVSVDYLLGKETKQAPTDHGTRSISDDDIKFALFGGGSDITDEMYEEVKRFAAYIRQRGGTER